MFYTAHGAYSGSRSPCRNLERVVLVSESTIYRDQCLALFFKLLNGYNTVSPSEIDIVQAPKPAHLPLNQTLFGRPQASFKASPLWHSTVFRTIPEWNNPPATVAEASLPSSFKSRLAALTP